MLQLETDRGVPLASPALLERLRAIDAALTVKPYKVGQNGIQWAAIMDWPAQDGRRARIQRGELPPDAAFDIIAWIPLDVSLDQVAAYIERGLTGLAGSVDHVHAMLHRIHRENQRAPEARWTAVAERALETFETFAGKVSPDVVRLPSAGVPGAANGPPKKGKAAKRAAS